MINLLNAPSRLSESEQLSKTSILESIKEIPENELLLNLGLFIDQRLMSRLLFLNFLYQKILSVQGVVMDLGCRWGQNAVVLQTLRSIYEPYNYQRKIIAFDTFTGFQGVCEKDGPLFKEFDAATTDQYEQKLNTIMSAHEQSHPLSHISKYEIVKGDVRFTIADYIKQHPETIVSLAFFDLDLYEPTKEALDALKPRLTKGSVLVFDELNYEHCPGETLAVIESLDIKNFSVQRFEHCSRVSYIVL
jgi:hypothetical protein